MHIVIIIIFGLCKIIVRLALLNTNNVEIIKNYDD